MDALDSAIIRNLGYGPQVFQWDVRASYARVARDLGVGEDTVRSRVRALEEQGVITGWMAIVHPALLGRVPVVVELEDIRQERKGEAVRALSLLDGTYGVFDHYRSGLFLVSFLKPGLGLKRFTDLAAAIADCRAEAWESPLPPVEVEPDAVDWRLIEAVRAGPRRPLSELAQATGFSPRTVQRRLTRLVEGRALFMSLKTDFSRFKGQVAVHARVEYASSEDREEVERVLLDPEGIVFAQVKGPMAVVSYMFPGLSQVDALREGLEAVDGDHRVRVDLIKSREVCDGWIDQEVQERIEASG